jgi:hypothetical protein
MDTGIRGDRPLNRGEAPAHAVRAQLRAQATSVPPLHPSSADEAHLVCVVCHRQGPSMMASRNRAEQERIAAENKMLLKRIQQARPFSASCVATRCRGASCGVLCTASARLHAGAAFLLVETLSDATHALGADGDAEN